MGLNHSPKVVTNDLILMLDAGNIKSFPGESTTNYIYLNNARSDLTYTSVDLSSYGGTMVQNHPGIIQPYDLNGSAFNAVYYNGGVGDPTNSQHAYWIYDDILKKPVVQMIDKNGSWQAKSFGLSMNAWSTYGYTVGTQYTLSWNQWTTHLSKRLDAGMYTRNSGGSWNFWDGRTAGSTSSTNTKTYTWERVYHTFTVSSNWDLTQGGYSIYMYGMSYINGQSLRIADVQLDIKGHPTHFLNGLYRGLTSATGGGWKDLSGNNNHAEFVGTIPYGSTYGGFLETPPSQITNYVILPESAPQSLTNGLIFSIDWWSVMKSNDGARYQMSMVNSGGANLFIIGKDSSIFSIYGCTLLSGSYPTYTVDVPQHLCVTSDGTNQYFYKNGLLTSTWSAPLSDIKNTTGFILDQEQDASKGAFDPAQNTYGWWSIIKMYNRALSSSEVFQNFNAMKSRFGLL